MASVIDQMKTLMDADIPLSTILTGGVYVRPFERNKTTQVFGDDQLHYRPSAYLIDGDAIPHFQSPAIPTAHYATPEVRLIAPATQNGKQALRDATNRIIVLFEGWVCTTDYGPKSFFTWAYTSSIIDSEEFIGAVTSTVTFQRTGVHVVLA